MGAGWLGQGRWRHLEVTAAWLPQGLSGGGTWTPHAGRSQFLPALAGTSPPNITAAALGVKGASTPSRSRQGSRTGRDPSLGTEEAKFVLDHTLGQWQAGFQPRPHTYG